MEKLFEGKVGIVTAAGDGIGRAAALAFAAEGAKVVVSDISEESGKETVRLIQENGGEATFLKCNVSNEEEVKQLVAETVSKYGTLNWAFNNAGLTPPPGTLHETKSEEWHMAYEVSVKGAYYSMKYEIPEMIKAGGGAIVNTSSLAGLRGEYGVSAHGAAKWAVNGLTQTAAMEYAKKGIRVNSICPGSTLTKTLKDHLSGESPERVKASEMNVPLGRMAQPEEQANAAVWLCSEKASYITGVNLPIDGGLSAKGSYAP